jgi:hypothetical protein
MGLNRLVKVDEFEIEGHVYSVRYFESRTVRGTLRYSSELLLAPGDRIIVDGNSLIDVESKVARLVPATIYSRLLAARAA